MSGNNETDLLANFKTLTGVEDTNKAKELLDRFNWDLEIAVSTYFQENENINSNIEINVHYNETEITRFNLSPRTTIYELKCLLNAQTNVPVRAQVLSGWTLDLEQNPEMNFEQLNFGNIVHLFMAQKDNDEESLRKIKIKDETNLKEYILVLKIETTIRTMKRYASFMTDTATENQHWSGWPVPDLVADSTCIGVVLPDPTTTLKLKLDEDMSEASNESYDSFNEDYFTEDPPPLVPLIPPNVEDEQIGSVSFTNNFHQRYGSVLNFFSGSLEEALNASCMKPIKERKMLAVYLHHDDSPWADKFCRENLCSDIIASLDSILFWGWDLTDEANKNMFLASSLTSLGPTVTDNVRSMTPLLLPSLIIVSRTHVIKVNDIIYGSTSLNSFVDVMMQAVTTINQQQESDLRFEQQRATREREKAEQDLAYQQSLLVDKAKEEALRKKQMEQKQEEERINREQEELRLKRLQEQNEAASKVPKEPADIAGQVSQIKFRSPSGESFQRRFLLSDKLYNIFNFVISQGFRLEEYKIMRNWPKRDISTLNRESILSELGFHNQEVINIEER